MAPAGYYNPFVSSTMLYICPRGSFSKQGSTSCHACPSALIPGAAHCGDDSHTCDAGEFFNGAQCQLVPAGHFNPFPNSSSFYSCPAGSFSNEGATYCESCAEDHYSSYPGASSCRHCPNGFYSYEGSKICQPCPKGHFSVPGFGCIPCMPGTYASQPGSPYCSLAPEGFAIARWGSDNSGSNCPFAIVSGSVMCSGFSESSCDAGFYFKNGECIRTPAGYHNPYPHSATIYICPPGTYSKEGYSHCSPCEDSIYPGATSCEAASVECGWGSYWDGYECVSVPAGFFKPVADSAAIYSCPSGTYSEEGWAMCEPCDSRQTSPPDEVNKQSCNSCPKGQFPSYNGETTECQFCPSGTTYSDESGDCISCPQMTYSSAGMSTCEPCPFGMYSSEGQDRCYVCNPGSAFNLEYSCSFCDLSESTGAVACLTAQDLCSRGLSALTNSSSMTTTTNSSNSLCEIPRGDSATDDFEFHTA